MLLSFMCQCPWFLHKTKISDFGVPAVNLKIACDWEQIGIKMIR